MTGLHITPAVVEERVVHCAEAQPLMQKLDADAMVVRISQLAEAVGDGLREKEDACRRNQLIAVGFKGRLDGMGVNTFAAYEEADATRTGGFPKLSPITESDRTAYTVRIATADDALATLTEAVGKIYAALVANAKIYAPGPFGDFIRVHALGERDYLVQVTQKAFPKPGTAVDMVTVFKYCDPDTREVGYALLTGVRGAEPGKGKGALFGGFTNMNHADSETKALLLDSPVYTAFAEVNEETKGFGVSPKGVALEDLRREYNAFCIPATATVRGKEYDSTVYYSGIFPTGDAPMAEGGELIAGMEGRKRVDTTTAFTCVVDLTKPNEAGEATAFTSFAALNAEVTKMRGGDDMQDKPLLCTDITEAVTTGDSSKLGHVEFGILHHRNVLEGAAAVAHQFHGKEAITLAGIVGVAASAASRTSVSATGQDLSGRIQGGFLSNLFYSPCSFVGLLPALATVDLSAAIEERFVSRTVYGLFRLIGIFPERS